MKIRALSQPVQAEMGVRTKFLHQSSKLGWRQTKTASPSSGQLGVGLQQAFRGQESGLQPVKDHEAVEVRSLDGHDRDRSRFGVSVHF